jgi:epoxyqueuosine reductase
MDWMERNPGRRSDPREILPGARSVISLAMNYYTGARHSNDPAAGKISRYAWGDDYHDIVRPKLLELLAYIRSIEPGSEGVVYVDTGPVLEKAWAARAGVGWEGKHTNVITQEFGSWVFLGEIILSTELEYDPPATDHCGTCTLCIEACPTDAIVEPYVLDSNRCISYLTIEHRGEIAAELGEKFDRWIYGCDICQDVCPWNEKFSVKTGAAGFAPRAATIAPELRHVAEMEQDEFSKTFSKSPVKRTKLSGMRRNAATVLGARRPARPAERRDDRDRKEPL